MKTALAIFIIIFSSYAEQAAPEQMLKRLYVDLYERFPTSEEVKMANGFVQDYEKLVDTMLASDEFKKTLANRIALHYSPNLKDKRNASGDVDPRYFKRYIRMRRLVKDVYPADKDFRFFIKDLVEGRGLSSAKPALYFYDQDEDITQLTGRFSDRVLGVPYKCAQCHDHREYNDILHLDFWSLAAFFKKTEVIPLKTVNDLKSLKTTIQKKFGTRLMTNIISRNDYEAYKDWVKKENRDIFIFKGDKMEFSAKEPKRFNVAEKLMVEQLLIAERKTYLKQLKINYTDDFRDVVNAAVPGTTESPFINVEPRSYLAKWVVRTSAKYRIRQMPLHVQYSAHVAKPAGQISRYPKQF